MLLQGTVRWQQSLHANIHATFGLQKSGKFFPRVDNKRRLSYKAILGSRGFSSSLDT
jgi:hypothetical protein